jgi:hypothetical protein
MVQLPTEQNIGDLPDHLPRRQGVGAWQPGDLARGAQELARGGEQFGVDLGMLGGALQRQQNQSQTAAADSQWAVNSIQTHDAMSQQTQPAIAAAFANNHDSNFDAAKSLISDPNEAAKWGMQHAPELARYKVATSDFATGLQKNQDIAGFENDSNTLMTSALSTPDPDARAGALRAITARGQSLVANGTFTPEQWQTRSAQIAHDYAVGQIKSATDRAKPRFDPTTGSFIPGDTTELESLNKLYQFEPNAPGGWGQPPGGAAPGTVVPPTTQPAPVGGFGNAVARTLGFEGGKAVTDVNGAQVKLGINKASNPDVDVGNLTPQAAAAIYKTRYWDPINGDQLAQQNPALAHVAFDTSVIAGPDKAKQMIAQSGGDPQKFMDLRDQYLQGLLASNPAKYSKAASAWENRDAGLRADISQPPAAGGASGAPPQRQNATNSYFIGDSVADGLRRAAGAPGDTATGRNPDHVQDAIDDADPKDLQGKTVYLSSGASNDPRSAAALASQLDSLKAKGVDMSNVRVIGVGDRPDFTANGVNTTLANVASKAGATFTGPLDPTNLRRNANDNSDNGVHLADWGKGLAQVSGANAMAQPVGTGAGPAFLGLPPAGATGPNPHLMPPRSQWPAGATAVQQDPDGLLRYTMGDGSTQPVPGSRATGAFGHPSPSNTGTVLDALKPVERAELGLQAQNAIGEVQRQNEAATKQYVGQSKKDLDSRVDDLIAGNGVGPNETAQIQQRYARSPLPEVRQQYATFAFIKQNLDAYSGKTPAQVQADVENKQRAFNAMREADPNNPQLGMVYDTLTAAQKYAKAFSEEAFKTPLERANKANLLPGGVTPIDPQDPNLDAAMSKRVSDAHTAADALGVPVKYFQQSERPMIKQIAQQGGQPMVDLARHIVEGAGPDAGAVFKEIGGDSQMMQWLGTHAAIGGDPEAANDVAGILHAKNDKTTSRELPVFDKSFMGHFDDPLAGAVSRFGPAFEDRTRAAAGMLMSAQADRDGKPAKVVNSDYNQDFVDKAHNLALGATYDANGAQYGGVAPRSVGHWYSGGSQDDRVVIPNNMKATDFNGVIGSIDNADLSKLPAPPMGKNGAPITARQIQDGRLEALPDRDGIFRGKYAVFTDGVRDDDHLVRDAQGKPWALDLAQPGLDTSLRSKNPTSYLGKSIPTPATPTPSGYERTPGVVALGSAAEEQ